MSDPSTNSQILKYLVRVATTLATLSHQVQALTEQVASMDAALNELLDELSDGDDGEEDPIAEGGEEGAPGVSDARRDDRGGG